ncbi:MAG: YdeI/OmpD-associated family protein, partial [Thermoleophilia bacterium]|nr:YdeI/OmpD-associated family protein [Thermoleophilia bacterium]
LALMFFKGALMEDPYEVLQEQGPNSRSALRMTFTSVDEIDGRARIVEDYVRNAVEVEAAGLSVGPAPEVEFVAELQERLNQDPDFRKAFEALTPGRQREYNLHFADAKQAKTREARIEKYTEHIFAGKGMRDR